MIRPATQDDGPQSAISSAPPLGHGWCGRRSHLLDRPTRVGGTLLSSVPADRRLVSSPTLNRSWRVSVCIERSCENEEGDDLANQTDLHRAAVGGGCRCGSDRRCTDGCGDKWADLLGKYLPVARQCSGQQRPSPRSVPPLRRHAVSARRPGRPSRRLGLTPRRLDSAKPNS